MCNCAIFAKLYNYFTVLNRVLYITRSSHRFYRAYAPLTVIGNFEIMCTVINLCCFTDLVTSQEIRKEFESIEQQWARKVEERDKEIENLKSRTRYLNSMVPEEKGVSAWKEIEVVQWINYNLPVS